MSTFLYEIPLRWMPQNISDVSQFQTLQKSVTHGKLWSMTLKHMFVHSMLFMKLHTHTHKWEGVGGQFITIWYYKETAHQIQKIQIY